MPVGLEPSMSISITYGILLDRMADPVPEREGQSTDPRHPAGAALGEATEAADSAAVVLAVVATVPAVVPVLAPVPALAQEEGVPAAAPRICTAPCA